LTRLKVNPECRIKPGLSIRFFWILSMLQFKELFKGSADKLWC
jgi:hypothetical protein